MAIKYIIGIDEVGRGPLAGPVTTAAVLMKKQAYDRLKRLKVFQDGKDSKKLTITERLFYFQKIKELKERGELDYAVSFRRHTTIDKIGIVKSVLKAIKSTLLKLNPRPANTLILLDGGLKAPLIFSHQKTIIRGDEQELIISMASIVAKVRRDRRMIRLAKTFTPYNFASNKGYGSKAHLKALEKHGPCAIHRRTFIKNLI